ncbi:hypothetical protein [Wenxinia saemankumensis]|uniref:DNA polymerase III, epsilon subunit n=1 Tax=Wenxinia saemankumensis TaxID=1447782 RepID=A0A1M6I294_9RHOB|nr:hypothetical protein [Wenxinia saemankumensis]SHJ28545.1 DNA polymerase III, epsilon subunit [Wenxinia saemankumensis]
MCRTITSPEAALERFAILDFEASSLSPASWPIEVGLSWIEDGEVRTWSSLIRPDPAWDLDDWSPASAAVHGIEMRQILDAPGRPSVAREFNRQLGLRHLVSDAPEFESHWLSRLLGFDIGPLGVRIEEFDAVSFAMFDGYALDLLYETVERRPPPHRAGPDTARLARGWLKALRHSEVIRSQAPRS